MGGYLIPVSEDDHSFHVDGGDSHEERRDFTPLPKGYRHVVQVSPSLGHL